MCHQFDTARRHPKSATLAPAVSLHRGFLGESIMSARIDLSGQKFGKLTAVKSVGIRSRSILWECQCECGKTKLVTCTRLRSGTAKSCGCESLASHRHRTHGCTGTATYRAWTNIKKRCYNPKWPAWHRYGGRGISMCERWNNSYAAFLADMGECPKGLGIDRTDNDGNYEPGNCEWVTQSRNCRNRNNSGFLTFNGQRKSAMDWAEEVGISSKNITRRIVWGWSVERALTEPVKKRKAYKDDF